MDWTNNENKLLQEIICKDETENADLEIEGQLFIMIKLIKRKQITKDVRTKVATPVVAQLAKRTRPQLAYSSSDSSDY